MMNAKNKHFLSSDGGRRKHWSLSNWSLIASLVIQVTIQEGFRDGGDRIGGQDQATVAPCVTWQPTSDQWRKQVEADWLVQLWLRGGAEAPPGRTATMDDAAGGVDGIKNGRWGFMTGAYPQWWQVDLGRPSRLPAC